MRASGLAFSWLPALVVALTLAPPSRAQESSLDWPPALPDPEVVELPSGARLVWLPDLGTTEEGDALFEISFGYVLPPGEPGLEAIARAWLSSSPAARAAELTSYVTGGEYLRIETPHLGGVRLRVPASQAASVIGHARDFLNQVPGRGELLDYVLDPAAGLLVSPSETPVEMAEAAVTGALLGQGGASPAPEEYLRALGTDRAWVVVSRPLSSREEAVLRQIRRRPARGSLPPTPARQSPRIADLELPSQAEGGVVVGSRIASVHYEGWFNTLVVDRALARMLPEGTVSALAPSSEDSVHLLRATVSAPLYSEDVLARMVSEIDGLQYGLPPSIPLQEVKQEALAHLGNREWLEWFALSDLWGPLGEGWSRIWNMTEAELRASATAFAREARVSALWAPSYALPGLRVEGLGGALDADAGVGLPPMAPGEVRFPSLPTASEPVQDPIRPRQPIRVEALGSGVTLAEGVPALFIGGGFVDLTASLSLEAPRSGPNGTWWPIGSMEPASLEPVLEGVRAQRLLFFLPEEEMARHRDTLEEWEGSTTDATDSMGLGRTASADLPALLILKAWLDTRLIEAGWTGLVEVGIAGEEGSDLLVRGDEARRARVSSWLSEAASFFGEQAAEEAFAGLRNAAGFWFERLRSDLQVLLWQRAAEGEVAPPSTVSLSAFRSFLDVYY